MAPPSFSLAGKSALITGGTRGIGRAIAEAYAAAGARVVVVSRKQESVDATVQAIEASGGEAAGFAVNVGRMDDAGAVVGNAAAIFGRLDILVNNAAVNPVYGPVEHTSVEAFDKIMAVNLRAPFELAKAARPLFAARGGGAVINIASIGALSPEAHLGIYSVSKAALLSLTRVLAAEWGKDRIRVNAICPGLIQTDFSAALWNQEAALKHTLATQALPHFGQPQDVAGTALLLASDAGAFITGSVMTVDGGYIG
ncbi:MAG: glucose 1-dehydrogenase [Gemmatimonadaceae bacterium]|nr:glucose 1-dehydrogenase [Gemmatimonadaceae bacterium]